MATPSTTANPTASPIDTTSWATFVSDRYGFTIGYPPDWTVLPADHGWTMEGDADQWLSTGQEVFYLRSHDVQVSAWGVPLDPGATMEQTWEDVEAWVEQYCQHTNDPSCAGFRDRAVRLCIERRDCHPGLLVPFEDDVQAFLRGGVVGDGEDVVVVAVWRGESVRGPVWWFPTASRRLSSGDGGVRVAGGRAAV